MTRSRKNAFRVDPPMPTRGRPPLPKGKARACKISFLLNEEEKTTIERMAIAHGLTLSEWIRRRATTTGAVRA
jgi:hypothetical protein